MTPQKSSPKAAASARPHDRPIDRVLHRLEGVKQRGPGTWVARCPAHDDRRPSLSIKETERGLVLLHCWVGCSAADIVDALGLGLPDLFPENARRLREPNTPSMRHAWEYRDALEGIAHEAAVARVITEAARSGHPLTDEDVQRLALAEERISDALRIAGGLQ